MKEWFEEWFDSPYYHILYKSRSADEACEFVDHLVDALKLPADATLLDLACGKGRHSIAFAAHGLDVTGLDLSKNSIDFASQFEHEKLHFYVHDMRHPFRINYYDMVCNLFTSFGYFKSQHDNQLAARSMYLAVKKDGRLLIDFVNHDFAVKQVESNLETSLLIEDIRFDISKRCSDGKILKQIRINDHGKQFVFEESLNSFTYDEMTSLFISQGFTLLDAFGDYSLGAYNQKESQRMILLFKK